VEITMTRSTILLIDALISLVLGLFLLVLPQGLVEWLGLPSAGTTFYPGILGAVVVAIAVALLLECRRKTQGPVGLGVSGAIAIDTAAALFVAGWLLLDGVRLPLRGRIVLWGVVAVLVSVSGLGAVTRRKQERG
jgi:hypothetical protein